MTILWQYNYNSANDELYHYGVLGMKWGRRKSPSISSVGKPRLKAAHKSHESSGTKSTKSTKRKKLASKFVSKLNEKTKQNGKRFVEDLIYGTMDPGASKRRQSNQERSNQQRMQQYDPLQYSRKYGNKRPNI